MKEWVIALRHTHRKLLLVTYMGCLTALKDLVDNFQSSTNIHHGYVTTYRPRKLIPSETMSSRLIEVEGSSRTADCRPR